jgi:hypothetical protein
MKTPCVRLFLKSQLWLLLYSFNFQATVWWESTQRQPPPLLHYEPSINMIGFHQSLMWTLFSSESCEPTNL